MLEFLFDIGTTITETLGYFGVFFGMLIESALIPIPSEAIMPLAGFLVSDGKMNFWVAVFTGAFGNLLGSILCYYLGVKGGNKLIPTFVDKYGKYFLISRHEYDKTVEWTNKYGVKIAFFSRLTPGIRSVISLPLGISKVNFVEFCVYTFAGSFIWSTFLMFIGLKLRDNWEVIREYSHYVDWTVIIVTLVLGANFVYKQIKKRGGIKFV